MSGCLLQASLAIREILQQPTCLWKVKAIFPQLFLALLFQVAFVLELSLQELCTFWGGHQKCQLNPIRCSTPVLPSLPATRAKPGVPLRAECFSLCRSAVQSVRVLLCKTGFARQVLAIEAQGGWDALLSAQTHLMGVRVVAR